MSTLTLFLFKKVPKDDAEASSVEGIVVEIDQGAARGAVVHMSRGNEKLSVAAETFEAALEKIKPATETIIAKLKALQESPHEIVVEFGLKLHAEFGVVVGKAGGDANF